MRNQLLDVLILVALVAAAAAFVYRERRQANLAGRRPRTALLVGATVAGIAVVFVGATVVLVMS